MEKSDYNIINSSKIAYHFMDLKSFCFLSLLFLFFNCTYTYAQDDLLNMLEENNPKDEKTFATFKTTRIVNSHSIETVKKGALDFRVTHHFGDIGGSGSAHTLFGLDQAADIRIAFEYGITDRLTAGFGRSKSNELLDGYFKFRLLQQTKVKMPVSVTLFANTGFTPQKNTNKEFDNFAHRFSYTFQALIARKFGQRLSLQLMPSFLHRNYVFDPADENDIFSLGIGGRIKLTKRFALLADYFYTFSSYRKENKNIYFPPLGVGVEIETGGHVFHLFFTNNGAIVENNYLANTTSSWDKGQFKFGFNISRTFGGK